MKGDVADGLMEIQLKFVGAYQVLPVLLLGVLKDEFALLLVEHHAAGIQVHFASLPEEGAAVRVPVCHVVEVYTVFGFEEQPLPGGLFYGLALVVHAGMEAVHFVVQPARMMQNTVQELDCVSHV